MTSGARAAELSALCRACGACCSGALFSYVALEPNELRPETRRRLRVFAEAGADRFRLPCAALEEAGCGVYEDRPRVCRKYVCGAYATHEREGGDIGALLGKVRRIRALFDRIRARGGGADGQWLPAPIGEIAQWDASKMAALRESVGEETLLDIAELGMRVRRDLGHVPKHD